ncbi:MAG: N-acyl homoserine lactonase family protein [Alphaproteobacteria bacterium]|nr:N-acyl homoserine lactonase family protein [Alphaproteobacteria bacterium]
MTAAPSPDAIPKYEVYAIRYADQGDAPVSAGSLMLSADHDQMIPGMAYYVYLIRGEGRTIAVDTGYAPVLADRLDSRLFFSGPDGLRRLGADPAGISDLIITHAHYDHVGNLDEFTGATFHIDTEMMPIVDGTDPCHPFFRQGYGKRDCATIRRLKAEGRLVEHRNVSVPWSGIELVHIGGHCRGQMAIRVNTRRGPIVLASDAAHLYQEWEEERPFGVFYDMKAMLDGYRLLSDLSGGRRTEMIAGHDVAVMSLFPAPDKALAGEVVALHADPVG